MIFELDGHRPDIAADAFVAHDANLIGKIVVGPRASIWFGCTLRGDNETITVGEGTNVQEATVCHTDMGFPLTIGANCTIGHKAMLHGCTIGDGALIGMGATILNGAVIGEGCLIGAGALVTEGKVIPPYSLVTGAPGKIVRELDPAARDRLIASALHYQANAARFRASLQQVG